MAIFNVLVYIVFACVMYVFARRSADVSPFKSRIDKYMWCYILFFAIVSGIRFRVGVDCETYAAFFNEGFTRDNTAGQKIERAFYYFANFLANNDISPRFGLGICAFVQIFFMVKGVMPYKYLLPFIPIVMFGGTGYLDYMNAVRQMMAATVFLYATRFIIDRKLLKYIMWILIASLIHQSIIFLLVLYLVPKRIDISRYRWISLAVLGCCFVTGISLSLSDFAEMIPGLLQFSGYEQYKGVMGLITEKGYEAEVKRFGPMQLSYLLTAAIVILYGPRLRFKYGKSMKYFGLWYLFAVAYGCLFFLLCNTSHIFLRPVLYLLPFQIVIVSLVLFDLFRWGKQCAAMRQIGWLVTAIIWASTTWNVIKNSSEKTEYTIYKVFWFYVEPDRSIEENIDYFTHKKFEEQR